MGSDDERDVADDGHGDQSPTPASDADAAAMASLASVTRLQVLLVLWDADDRPLRFGDLRERVGMRDPGQFRYHLRKLEDRFVRKTPEGYDITMAGVNVVWAVRSGDLTPGTDVAPFETDVACSECGAPLSVRYEDELLYVTCPSCGQGHGMTPFHPSGLVGRTGEEILATYERVVRTQSQLCAHDVCPRCYGSGTFEVVTDESDVPVGLRAELSTEELAEVTRYDPADGEVDVVWTCSRCGFWMNLPLVVVLSYRDEVVRFYRDHGVDLDSIPSWELPGFPSDVEVTETGTTPLSLHVTVSLDDESLAIAVEEGRLDVDTERTTAADSSQSS